MVLIVFSRKIVDFMKTEGMAISANIFNALIYEHIRAGLDEKVDLLLEVKLIC